jgi:hypothetical protein
MTTTAATIVPFSTPVKTAYNKGWASQAKTVQAAVENFVKSTPDGELDWFVAGYDDKHNGNAKWTTMPIKKQDEAPAEAPAEEAPKASTGSRRSRALRASELNKQPKAAPKAEAPAPAPAPRPRRGKANSIAALAATITKDMPAAEVRKIRKEIATRKNHYKMGWNSYLSPLFKGDHSKALAGYYKRHGAPAENPYVGDWEDGFAASKKGEKFGSIWS